MPSPILAAGMADARIFPAGSLVWVRVPAHNALEAEQIARHFRSIPHEDVGHCRFIVTNQLYDPTLMTESSERELFDAFMAARQARSVQDHIAKIQERFWIVRKS